MAKIDKQTIYRDNGQYYIIHRDELLKKGYRLTKLNRFFAIFTLEDFGEQTTHHSKEVGNTARTP